MDIEECGKRELNASSATNKYFAPVTAQFISAAVGLLTT
jgi:hypothetical protein